MESAVSAIIDSSRFPERTRLAYLESFRSRRMNHRFHYETEKQAQQWLALHEAYSPARTDVQCLETYERAFSEIADFISETAVTLISLGCGGGQKDLSLLKSLHPKTTYYIPADVSLSLVLTAHLRCKEAASGSSPILLDLAEGPNLRQLFENHSPQKSKRLVSFFGMLPNFEPGVIFPTLAASIAPGDYLLLSANLSPGPDYLEGMKKILPLYDNDLTRRWLATVLLDAGLQLNPCDLEFGAATAAPPLARVEAGYRFRDTQTLRLDNETFTYKEGDWFQLFYSYRHTAQLLCDLLAAHHLEMTRQWITPSEEEGIFLCRKV